MDDAIAWVIPQQPSAWGSNLLTRPVTHLTCPILGKCTHFTLFYIVLHRSTSFYIVLRRFSLFLIVSASFSQHFHVSFLYVPYIFHRFRVCFHRFFDPASLRPCFLGLGVHFLGGPYRLPVVKGIRYK